MGPIFFDETTMSLNGGNEIHLYILVKQSKAWFATLKRVKLKTDRFWLRLNRSSTSNEMFIWDNFWAQNWSHGDILCISCDWEMEWGIVPSTKLLGAYIY